MLPPGASLAPSSSPPSDPGGGLGISGSCFLSAQEPDASRPSDVRRGSRARSSFDTWMQ